MNRIIFELHETAPDGTVAFTGARAEHLRTFLHAEPGQCVKVGQLNGSIGTAEILEVNRERVVVRPACSERSLQPWFDLVLAVPRPRAMKRLWAQLAAMGAGRIWLVNAAKVEKSYFSSHCLREEEYKPLLIDGLMQAGTTPLPSVEILQRLSALPARLPEDAPRFLAHPGAVARPDLSACGTDCRPILAVGPDGGWTDDECAFFFDNGFSPFSLGRRPLRTDTACIALIAVLQSLTEGA